MLTIVNTNVEFRDNGGADLRSLKVGTHRSSGGVHLVSKSPHRPNRGPSLPEIGPQQPKGSALAHCCPTIHIITTAIIGAILGQRLYP